MVANDSFRAVDQPAGHLSHVACFPRYDLPFQKAPAVKRTNARMIPAITSKTVIMTSRFVFFASPERSVIQRKLIRWKL